MLRGAEGRCIIQGNNEVSLSFSSGTGYVGKAAVLKEKKNQGHKAKRQALDSAQHS